MSKLKESLGTKKLVAVVVVIASVLAFSTFTMLENTRKEEEKARLEAVQLGHQTKTCGAFGYSLDLLTSNKFPPKKMKETNTLLNEYLEAWSIDDGDSNDLYTKLSKYQRVIADSLPEANPIESKELLAFQKSNFNALISLCNLEDSYTYPSSITFMSGCEIDEVKNLVVELQKKISSNSWTKITAKEGYETDYCKYTDAEVGFTDFNNIGADFSIDLGLVRNNLASYGTYRVRWHFKGGQRHYDGERELFSCEFKAKRPDDTRYPDTDTVWVAGDVYGCDKTSGSEPEPNNEEVPAEIDPWSRDFTNEWLEGTAKFTWCWNRGLQYSEEADACY